MDRYSDCKRFFVYKNIWKVNMRLHLEGVVLRSLGRVKESAIVFQETSSKDHGNVSVLKQLAK
jgi:hypothetical protein